MSYSMDVSKSRRLDDLGYSLIISKLDIKGVSKIDKCELDENITEFLALTKGFKRTSEISMSDKVNDSLYIECIDWEINTYGI
jgi:hypothetical protein